MIYRKRQKRTLTAVRLSDTTLAGLDQLRELFHRRWPRQEYLTLSLVLEELLVKNLKRLSRPEVMAVELADWKRRYGKLAKPARKAS